jgi:hypothetical protein
VLDTGRVPASLRATPPGSTSKEGLCRGIGAAVWIRNVPNERLPVFETLTWCVTTEVVEEGQSNAPYEEY